MDNGLLHNFCGFTSYYSDICFIADISQDKAVEIMTKCIDEVSS